MSCSAQIDRRRFGLTGFRLKLLAIAIMTVDHIGAFLLERSSEMYPICRAVGRLAFPIFCLMLVEGALHTRSAAKYAARLAAFALISNPPYNLAGGREWYSVEELNVFFTLLLGLLAIEILMKNIHTAAKVAACLGICAVAEALNTDYGGYGILTIIIFFLLRDKAAAKWIVFGALTFVNYDLNFYTDAAGALSVEFVNARQMLAALAFIPDLLYNGERGGDRLAVKVPPQVNKYLFYVYYPAHLLIIWLIRVANL